MNIDSIHNGIVIDHITAGCGMKLYDLLGLGELDCSVAIIKNVVSGKMGKKDIIKIGQIIDLDFAVLGYLDPGITVNIIQDGKLCKREHLSLPERVKGIIKCKNPRCITSTEQELEHEFKLTDRENKVYRCVYCESKAPEQTR